MTFGGSETHHLFAGLFWKRISLESPCTDMVVGPSNPYLFQRSLFAKGPRSVVSQRSTFAPLIGVCAEGRFCQSNKGDRDARSTTRASLLLGFVLVSFVQSIQNELEIKWVC